MQFQVPQFIERELKIVGPLTFKQFLFIGGGGLGVVLLYLVLASRSFLLFVLCSILIVVGGLALAFLKIEGRDLPIVIVNLFSFFFSPKTYFWKKKVFLTKAVEKPEPKKEIKEKPALKISEKSQLQELSTKLETGMR